MGMIIRGNPFNVMLGKGAGEGAYASLGKSVAEGQGVERVAHFASRAKWTIPAH